jgi:CubicO group peptidase (beta-lactamase class C family)
MGQDHVMTSDQTSTGPSASATSLLRSLAERFVEQGAAPGVSIGLVKDGEVALTIEAGHADPDRRIPVRSDHLYEIGSISKSFTALTVLSLMDEGRLNLTDTVEQHVPWFEVMSDFPAFTLRHLLDHSSGLIMGSDSWPDELAQVHALRTSRTGSAPDSIFHYSNVGFMTLGVVVGAVTGEPCPEVMKSRVLDVVGMPNTITSITDGDRARMAVGTQPVHEDQPWRPGDPLAPATWFEISAVDGNVASTASDMGRYLAMLLNGGELEGRRVISQRAFEAMVTPTSPGGEPAPGYSRYGLGINIEEIAGQKCITHGGGMVGYSTFLIGELHRRFGIIVLTNAPGDAPGAQWLARACFDLLAADVEGRLPHPDELPTYTPSPKPELPHGSDGSVDDRWESYVGHYRSFSPWFTHLRIAAKDGRLWLVAPNGVEAPGTVELVEIEPGVFREGTDPRLPECLTIGPVIDGQAVWVSRHDCRYSRTFRD